MGQEDWHSNRAAGQGKKTLTGGGSKLKGWFSGIEPYPRVPDQDWDVGIARPVAKQSDERFHRTCKTHSDIALRCLTSEYNEFRTPRQMLFQESWVLHSRPTGLPTGQSPVIS